MTRADSIDGIRAELESVRRLLLTPDGASMRLCESRLRALTGDPSIHQGIRSTEIKSALANIRFLLDRARDFWMARRPSSQPPVQYIPGGAILASREDGTFSVEV